MTWSSCVLETVNQKGGRRGFDDATESGSQGKGGFTKMHSHRTPYYSANSRSVSQAPRERLDLLTTHGFRPGDAEALLAKGEKPSASVVSPKGTSVTLRELFQPPVPGRKVVLLGDTCDSRAIVGGPNSPCLSVRFFIVILTVLMLCCPFTN